MSGRELSALYDKCHDAILAAGDKVPGDILRQWPNALGTLRREPGQPYHRSGPNGRENPLTDSEVSGLRFFFQTTIRRLAQ